MLFIDENTAREDLVKALTDTLEGIQFCIDRGIDPELPETPTETIRDTLVDFIAEGDECGAC